MKVPSCRLFPVLFVLPVLLSAFGVSRASASPEYSAPVDIGALAGGLHFSSANGFNNAGQIVGDSEAGNFETHAFLYDSAHGIVDLGTLPGGHRSSGGAINNAGEVAGTAATATLATHLFLYTPGAGMADLGNVGGGSSLTATGINASNQICGSLSFPGSGGDHAYLYSGGAFHDLGVPSGYVQSDATGLNDSGQVCGYCTDGSGRVVPFLHSGIGLLTAADLLPVPSGYTGGKAVALNASGQACGSLTGGPDHAFLYSGGALQALTLPGSPGFSDALGINQSGLLLIRAAGNVYLYNSTANTSQAVSVYATRLNDSGHTAGSGFPAGDNCPHAVLDGTDIGALPDGSDSIGYSINAAGQVAGKSRVDASNAHAIVFDSTGLHDLGLLPPLVTTGPNQQSEAFGINASGQVAGISAGRNTGGGFVHGFLYDSVHGMTDLGTLSGRPADLSQAFGLNDAGQVVGLSETADSAALHAFVYDSLHGMVDLGALPGSVYSQAAAINAAGTVVGQSVVAGQTHAFMYDGVHGMSDLGFLPGGTFAEATALNVSGAVVGTGDVSGGAPHGFLYDSVHGLQDLGTLPGGVFSAANGINAAGVIVGTGGTASGQPHAVVWDSLHGVRDLNTLLPAGTAFTLVSAYGINDKGQITGYGINASGQTHGFVLSPAAPCPNHSVMDEYRWHGWPVESRRPESGRHVPWSMARSPDGLPSKSPKAPTATSPVLLWTNSDGRNRPCGTSRTRTPRRHCPIYGPFGGWTAKALTVGPDNAAHLLVGQRRRARVAVEHDRPEPKPRLALVAGPYSGWSGVAIGIGPDNHERLLWDNTSGQDFSLEPFRGRPGRDLPPVAGPLWRLDSQSLELSAPIMRRISLWDNTFGPSGSVWNLTDADPCGDLPPGRMVRIADGWVQDLSVGVGGNKGRLLWDNIGWTGCLCGTSPIPIRLATCTLYGSLPRTGRRSPSRRRSNRSH